MLDRKLGLLALFAAAQASAADSPEAAALTATRARRAAVAAELAEAAAAADAERRLSSEGHSTAGLLAARADRVAVLESRLRACDRHLRHLEALPLTVAAVETPGRHPAEDLRAARAAALAPHIELLRERIRRTGDGPEQDALRRSLDTHVARRAVVLAGDASEFLPADAAQQDAADRIAAHWRRCVAEAFAAAPFRPASVPHRETPDADAVAALAEADPYFAAEAEWLRLERDAAAAAAVADAAADRLRRVAARTDPPGLRWVALAADPSVRDAAAAERAARGDRLRSSLTLAQRRADAFAALRREGHASWLEAASAAADRDALRAGLAALKAEGEFADARLAAARRLAETQLAAH